MQSRQLIWFIMVLFVFGCTDSVAVGKEEYNSPISILVEQRDKKIFYQVDGKQMDLPEILKYLGELTKVKDPHYPVIVLINQNVSFSDLGNLKGLILKAGFGNIRFFSFNKETKKMLELYFCNRSVPFSVKSFPPCTK